MSGEAPDDKIAMAKKAMIICFMVKFLAWISKNPVVSKAPANIIKNAGWSLDEE
jgi:hypothetical protein